MPAHLGESHPRSPQPPNVPAGQMVQSLLPGTAYLLKWHTFQLDVLRHDGHAFGVDGTQVGVLEQANKVGLRGFLECKHGRALESQVGLELLRDLANETLEGQLADEQVGALLVAADLAKRNGTGAVAVGLLDTSSGGGGIACCLGGELLAGRFASGGLTGGLLGTGR